MVTPTSDMMISRDLKMIDDGVKSTIRSSTENESSSSRVLTVRVPRVMTLTGGVPGEIKRPSEYLVQEKVPKNGDGRVLKRFAKLSLAGSGDAGHVSDSITMAPEKNDTNLMPLSSESSCASVKPSSFLVLGTKT